jgi:hypothetical protein
MGYKREELIALMREMEKQIALCHIRPQLAGALADELEKSVPVVRCKDCKHYWKNKNTPVYLDKCVTVSDDDFCSDGDRKDGDGDAE